MAATQNLPLLVFSTTKDMTAQVGVPDGQSALVLKPGIVCTLDRLSVAAIDGTSVFAAEGGGRWVVSQQSAGTDLVIAPLGPDPTTNVVRDDAPQIVAAAAAAVANQRRLVFSAGTYSIQTSCDLTGKTGLRVKADNGVLFNSTLANTGAGGFANSIFKAKSALGAQNALTADVKRGAKQIVVTAVVAVGARILLACTNAAIPNVAQAATVVAVGGAGNLTLTLDEEIEFAYFTVANGAYAAVVNTPTENMDFDLGGAKFYGTGDRVFEWAQGSRNILVKGAIVDHTLGAKVNGFLNTQYACDIGCRDCWFENCVADGGVGTLSGTTGTAGFAVEASLRCGARYCEAQNMSGLGYGFAAFDSKICSWVGTDARNCVTGYYYGANDAAGTEGSEVQGVDVKSSGCSTVGHQFDKASIVRIAGLSSVADAKGFSNAAGSASVDLVDVRFVAPDAGAYNVFDAIVGEVRIENALFDLTASGGIKTICDWSSGTGTLKISRSQMIAGTYGFYLEDGVAQKLLIGKDVDISTAATAAIRLGTTSVVEFEQRDSAASTNAGGDANYTYVYNEYKNAIIIDTSAITAGRDRVLPNIKGLRYIVKNGGAGAFAMTFKVAGQAGVAVAQNKHAIIYCNGTDYVRVTPDT